MYSIHFFDAESNCYIVWAVTSRVGFQNAGWALALKRVKMGEQIFS